MCGPVSGESTCVEQRRCFRPGSLECSLIALSIALSITLTSGEDNAPEHGSPARVAELLKELELPESTDLQRRRDAARELSQMHPLPPEAIAVLAKPLDTFDRGGVQRYATIALAGAGARPFPPSPPNVTTFTAAKMEKAVRLRSEF